MTSSFRVVALIAARNENDVIGQVIEDLVTQGVAVYFIDDGSTDGTLDTVQSWTGRGVIGLERRPASATFNWTEILHRKEQLAAELEASWFIHQDADEFRQSPFPGKSLSEAIRIVDELGYNAIDFRVLNFRPTTADRFDATGDVRRALTRFEPAEYWETPQVKAWKKTGQVDLASSGGHDVRFADRVVCPVQFLLRHYPVRSQAQGEHKIFADRQPRFDDAERNAGWHVQYDRIQPGESLLRDPGALTEFDEVAELRRLRIGHRDTPELEATVKRLQAANEQLEHARAQTADAIEQLRRRTEEFEHTRSNLESERELARSERDSERRHSANLQDLLVASGRKAAEAAVRFESDIRGLQAEVASIYQSRSWRWMAPMRWALGLFTRSSSRVGDRTGTSGAQPEQIRIAWGDLDRVSPVSDIWGLDRGKPIDRYYIEAFLGRHAADIQGTVFEIKDPVYTRMFGQARVLHSVVVDVDPGNPLVTLRADLTKSDQFPSSVADCFVLTQTLHIIYEHAASVRTAMQVLKPGGVLLCTIPAVSRVNYENGGLRSGDFWRMTRAAVEHLFGDLDNAGHLDIQTFGNVRTCTAFLYGLAVEDMPAPVLDFHDPWFPLIHCVRVVKGR